MTKQEAIEKLISHNCRFKEAVLFFMTWNESETVRENVERIGITQGSARQYIEKYKLKYKSAKTGRQYSLKDYSHLLKKWSPPKSIIENAKNLGVKKSFAHFLRAKFGLPYLKETKLHKSLIVPIQESKFSGILRKQYEAGVNTTQLSQIHKLTRRRICQILNKNGKSGARRS